MGGRVCGGGGGGDDCSSCAPPPPQPTLAHTLRTNPLLQVGDVTLDHNYWGSPEDMTMSRPAYKVSPTAPGSDVAAESAAALAAASLAFKATDPVYAATLLAHARQLFTFADSFRGKYSDTVPVQGAYVSYSYNDELVWAAAWMHRATGQAAYLSNAEAGWQQSLW